MFGQHFGPLGYLIDLAVALFIGSVLAGLIEVPLITISLHLAGRPQRPFAKKFFAGVTTYLVWLLSMLIALILRFALGYGLMKYAAGDSARLPPPAVLIAIWLFLTVLPFGIWLASGPGLYRHFIDEKHGSRVYFVHLGVLIVISIFAWGVHYGTYAVARSSVASSVAVTGQSVRNFTLGSGSGSGTVAVASANPSPSSFGNRSSSNSGGNNANPYGSATSGTSTTTPRNPYGSTNSTPYSSSTNSGTRPNPYAPVTGGSSASGSGSSSTNPYGSSTPSTTRPNPYGSVTPSTPPTRTPSTSTPSTPSTTNPYGSVTPSTGTPSTTTPNAYGSTTPTPATGSSNPYGSTTPTPSTGTPNTGTPNTTTPSPGTPVAGSTPSTSGDSGFGSFGQPANPSVTATPMPEPAPPEPQGTAEVLIKEAASCFASEDQDGGLRALKAVAIADPKHPLWNTIGWCAPLKRPTLSIRWGLGLVETGVDDPSIKAASAEGRLEAVAGRVGPSIYQDLVARATERMTTEGVKPTVGIPVYSGNELEIHDEVQDEPVDVVLIFYVHRRPDGRRFEATIKARVIDAETRTRLWSSDTLSTESLKRDPDAITKFNKSLREGMAAAFTLGPDVSFDKSAAAARARDLSLDPPDDAISALLELCFFHRRGVITEAELQHYMLSYVDSGVAKKLINGTVADKADLLLDVINQQ